MADVTALVELSERVGLPIEACTFIGSSAIRQYAEEWSLDYMLKLTEETVGYAVAHGLPVMYVTEDTTRAAPETIRRLYRTAINAGAKRVCVCDTVGHITPRGVRNCNEGGCPRCNAFAEVGTKLDECFCSHGEENAITQAAFHGVSVRGGRLYTTFSPCLMCTKMIINAGIVEVIYNADYPLGGTALELLREAGVKVRRVAAPGA